MKVTFFLFIAIIMASVTTAQACEFHGGFGGNTWSGFGNDKWRSSPNDYSKTRRNISDSALKLTIPAMVSAKRGLETEVSIKHQDTSALAAPVIDIAFDSNPYISIETSKVNLDGKTGEHTFTVLPRRVGTHRLVLTAKYVDQPDIASRHEVIYLKVSE